MVHHRGGKAGRIYLEREHALLAQRAQKNVAALDDFLRGDVAEHFARGCRAFTKEFTQLRLADHGKEHEMTLREAGDAFDHFGCRGGFRKIGEPDDEATAFLESEQGFNGALVIGFKFLSFNLCEAFEQRAHVS